MLWLWVIIFIASLVALVKGADWLLAGAERVGLALGLSPFIVGVVIVGAGTSFPELISAIAAVTQNAAEIVPANAIGSNIANILLIVGFAAVLGRKLTVSKSLIDLDLPLLAISTVLFLGIAWDGQITLAESIILLIAYGIYISYTIVHHDDTTAADGEVVALPSRADRRKRASSRQQRPRLTPRDFLLLGIGTLGLVIGAKYLIDSVIALAEIMAISTGAITIIAVAFGTSLPELLVSAKAALSRNSEVALGNIFGSNIFNILVVTGIPGLITTLHLDDATLAIGVPALAAATLLFVISGISRRIHGWEGSLYLLAYVLFIGKIFGLF